MADFESYVQVATDGSGKKIRNRKRTIIESDGTSADVYSQVVAADTDDESYQEPRNLLEELVCLQQKTYELLQAVHEYVPDENDFMEPEQRALNVRMDPPTALWARTGLPNDVAPPNNPVRPYADPFGRQVVLPVANRELILTQGTTISASTSETTIGTAYAGGFLDLVMLIISNTSTATNTRIDIRDKTSGTVLFSLQSVGGAAPVGFALPVPIPQTTANNNWTAQCGTSTTDIRVYAVFVKNR